jgi:hypothetical protein
MVLDDPAGIEAVLLGIADLGDHIVVKLRDLVVAALLDFELEEQTKFHARLRGLASACISTGRAKSVNRRLPTGVPQNGCFIQQIMTGHTPVRDYCAPQTCGSQCLVAGAEGIPTTGPL